MHTADFKPASNHEQRMWTYMQKHPRFQYAEVMSAAQVSRHHMDCFAAKLRRHNLIHPVGREGAAQFFTVMDDAAAKAFEATRKGSREGCVWTNMHSLGKFSAADLLAAIGPDRPDISEEFLRRYCGVLLKAGYLAVVQKARPGVHPARYMLVNYTGPLPPVERTLKVVVDGNEDRAVYAAGCRI